MFNKINKKARSFRRNRVFGGANLSTSLDSSYGVFQAFQKRGHKFILFLFVFIIPIYPTLSTLVHSSNPYEFERDDIDESSILGSYVIDGDEYEETDEVILSSSDSFLSVSTILDDERYLVGTNEIVEYEVKPGDNVSAIAYSFKVSSSSIYRANGFSKSHLIRPGDLIKIPPVSGVIHQVKENQTIDTIAKEYEVDRNKILAQNLLSIDDIIKVGDVLVIPGAIKKEPKPVIKVAPKTYTNANTDNQNGTGYNFAKYASSQYVNAGGRYKLVRRQPKANFYWGNCTWYVAQYKNVDWQGNANQWLINAKKKGHSTGNSPTLGSIVVLDGTGYNPRYGHVAIVMDIKESHIIVSDMNYRKINEVTYRKIPINDRAIQGYIYID